LKPAFKLAILAPHEKPRSKGQHLSREPHYRSSEFVPG